jgi:polyisoprenoid-binding protein YceI
VVENGELKGGEIVLDMTSITVTDLKGEEKGKLEGHLKTGDFFETDKYPTGKFVLTGAKAEKKGDNTHMLEGNLTLKGIEKGVKFPAKVELTNEGKGAKIIAKDILIDRTLWGITYKGMADNAIKNDIGLSFTVVTKN